MILVIKHIDIEGLGTFGDYLEKKGYKLQTIAMGQGGLARAAFDSLEAVISLGGPMNVYEEDKYPFLSQENVFIQEVIRREIPFMGICLGSQLLAKAGSAKVVQSPVKEVGFYKVQLTAEGKKDPLFKGLNSDIDVFHWHGDMFQIPQGAALLVTSSDGCPHQALRVGPCAYGVQFHVEITDISIREWSDQYVANHKECKDLKGKLLGEYNAIQKSFDGVAEKIYENFHHIIQIQKKKNAAHSLSTN